MAHITLQVDNPTKIRTVNPRMMSYNVEMTEVTGGTFWKAYSPEQIAGTEKFPPITSLDPATLMQWYDPVDTTSPKLINLAKALGPVWMRVSGTWATKTYYDFDGTGVVPEGYQNRLTKEQWINAVKFADAIGAKILISVANCEGLHSAEEPWNPSQAEQIFALSKELGHPIDAVEFTNEPNIMEVSGFPKGYKAKHFRRDQEIFHTWVRQNYPETLLVGPCSTDSNAIKSGPAAAEDSDKGGAGIADVMYSCSTDELMCDAQIKLDVFSYHYYNGISERLEAIMPTAHWQADQAASDAYLSVAERAARAYAPFRDKYVPGGEMWVTESGDAGGGGCTWASTYLDVLRTLNELGVFATVTDGVIFHNTLASSDYGFLQHGTFEPRPNYYAVLLWNTLMGTTVYDSKIPAKEGSHVFCHSRRDGNDGCAYLVVNNSLEETTTVELPKEAAAYVLAGRDGMRSRIMTLNGRDLVLGEKDALPNLEGVRVCGSVELAPGSCAFFVL